MRSIIKTFATLFSYIVLTVISYSCKTEELPIVSTSPVSNITPTTATSGGNITSDGESEVTARGVCWGINANPTISDSKTNDGTGTGQFTSTMTGLTPNTLYYVRAYATNEVGTVYGNEVTFTEKFRK